MWERQGLLPPQRSYPPSVCSRHQCYSHVSQGSLPAHPVLSPCTEHVETMPFAPRSAEETTCVHRCMQEYNMELPMLSPKTFPHAGERVTQRLTVGDEQQVLGNCFATNLLFLLKRRPETLWGKLNFPELEEFIWWGKRSGYLPQVSMCYTAFEWDVLRTAREEPHVRWRL